METPTPASRSRDSTRTARSRSSMRMLSVTWRTRARAGRSKRRSRAATWQEALRAWEVATDIWPLTYTRFRLAEALCGTGERATATDLLRDAARTCERLGAQPLLDDVLALARRARIDLEAAGATASPAPDSVPFGLTDREREVLALVSAGRSN